MTGNQRMRRQAGKRDKESFIYLAYGTSEPAQELTQISYLFKILVKGNSPEERFTTPLWDLEQAASVFFLPLVDSLFCANKDVLQNLFWAFRKKTLRQSLSPRSRPLLFAFDASCNPTKEERMRS